MQVKCPLDILPATSQQSNIWRNEFINGETIMLRQREKLRSVAFKHLGTTTTLTEILQ